MELINEVREVEKRMSEKDLIAENKKLKEELEKYRRLEIELSTEIELLR